VTLAGIHMKNAQPPYLYQYPGSPVITSISRTSNIVTATVSAANAYVCFSYSTSAVQVKGVTGGTTDFGGTFWLTYPDCTGTTIKWAQTGPDETGTVSASSIAWGFWGGGAECITGRSGTYLSFIGNHLDHCTDGIGTQENDSNGFASITTNVLMRGNHLEYNGQNQDGLTHPIYNQSWWTVVEGNLIDNYTTGAQGSGIKFRGISGIFRYNYLNSAFGYALDLVENQDGNQFTTYEQYFGNGWPEAGDTLGVNGIASLQEAGQTDFIYGNICKNCSRVHYNMDHDGQMADRIGLLSFYNNTWDQVGLLFDNGGGSCGGCKPPFIQRFYAANNALYTDYSLGVGFNRYESAVNTWQSNMMKNDTFSIFTPIVGARYNDGSANGWPNECDYVCWVQQASIDLSQTGLSNANFLTTSTVPYSTSTFVPITSSPLNNAGSVITGPARSLPVRYQYSPSVSALTTRLNPLTIGGADSGPPPTLSSISVSPNPVSTLVGMSYPMAATCTYSDSTANDCTLSATWSTTSTHFTVGSTGVVTGTSLGTGDTVKATIGAVNGSAVVNIVPRAPTFSGNLQMRGMR